MNANDRQEVREILAESLERIGSGYGAHLDIRAEAAHLRQLQLAEPEKPAPNPLILASSDGRFQMQVWVKPRRLEAQILEQPEEWRRTGADSEGYPGKWLDCGRGREVWSYNYPSFSYSHITLFLRGASKAMDSQIFVRDFVSDSDRDAYLAKLEAAVAAMPKVEPKPKFVVGQWAMAGGIRRRISSTRWSEAGRYWRYVLSSTGTMHADYPESEMTPCSPVCHVEQLCIGPGDKVRLEGVPVGRDGKPMVQEPCFVCPELDRAGEEGTAGTTDGRFGVRVDFRSQFGSDSVWVYRWNLHLVKRGPSGPGGKP